MTFVESSPNVGWLSLKTLRMSDDFRWNLSECRMTFVESSTKALQNQDYLCWKLYWKPIKRRLNRDNTKFRDKIAYVGGPSFAALLPQHQHQQASKRTTLDSIYNLCGLVAATIKRFLWTRKENVYEKSISFHVYGKHGPIPAHQTKHNNIICI